MEVKDRVIDNGASVSGPVAGSVGAAGARRDGTVLRWVLGGLAVLMIASAALWVVGLGKLFGQLPAVEVGPLRSEANSVPAGSASAVAVDVSMGQGTLTLAGGAQDLLDADFSYNVAAWKPQVSYSESNAQGQLNITQASSSVFVSTPDGVRNDWTLRLKNDVPMTLAVSLGAGSGTIKLGGLKVSKFDLDNGAGMTTLDLSGAWQRDLVANVHSGIGKVIIRLPSNVGARVAIDSNSGTVDSGSLRHEGKYYSNSAYGNTAVTLEIAVSAGVGTVKLETDR